jgi:hypothetical protein
MSATLPPESGRYDCDVYYGKDMGKFA